MQACKRAQLIAFLALVIAFGFPATSAASAACLTQPGLSLEAISITRLDDETVQWLSLLETADLVSMLRRATPYVESKNVPWQYCIALTTEQGAVSCYYNAEENLICFPPYTSVLRLPNQTRDLVNTLFSR